MALNSSLPGDSAIVIDNWCHTHPQVIKLNYTWTIHNFHFSFMEMNSNLTSSNFSDGIEEKIKWNLHANNIDNPNYLSLYVRFVSPIYNEYKANCKISILNAKREKVNIKDFDNSQKCFKNCYTVGFSEFILLDEASKLLFEDKLTILCELSYTKDSCSSSQADFVVPTCKLVEDFGNLLESAKLYDVTLIVGDHKVGAHKAILAARSAVFAAMFDHDFEEQKLNCVTIEDFSYEVVKAMLHFIYTGTVSKLYTEMAADLLVAADKYNLEKLKVMCEEMLYVSLSIEKAAETLLLADKHNANQLKSNTCAFIKNHIINVVKTKSWKDMIEAHPNLIIDNFNAIAIK